MDEFQIGDFVQVVMRPDGAVFEGVLTDFDAVAVYVNGCGFPQEDVATMQHVLAGEPA